MIEFSIFEFSRLFRSIAHFWPVRCSAIVLISVLGSAEARSYSLPFILQLKPSILTQKFKNIDIHNMRGRASTTGTRIYAAG